jgi:hypothetical protein
MKGLIVPDAEGTQAARRAQAMARLLIDQHHLTEEHHLEEHCHELGESPDTNRGEHAAPHAPGVVTRSYWISSSRRAAAMSKRRAK